MEKVYCVRTKRLRGWLHKRWIYDYVETQAHKCSSARANIFLKLDKNEYIDKVFVEYKPRDNKYEK